MRHHALLSLNLSMASTARTAERTEFPVLGNVHFRAEFHV